MWKIARSTSCRRNRTKTSKSRPGHRPLVDASAAGEANMAGGARNRVYGLHAIRGLLDTRPRAIVSAKVLDQPADGRLAEIVGAIEALGIRVDRVRRTELDRLSEGGTHQG